MKTSKNAFSNMRPTHRSTELIVKQQDNNQPFGKIDMSTD
jgi:hypothetical protein